jgi:hypothetical protein
LPDRGEFLGSHPVPLVGRNGLRHYADMKRARSNFARQPQRLSFCAALFLAARSFSCGLCTGAESAGANEPERWAGGNEVEGSAVSIRSSKEAFDWGEPIPLQVCLTNRGDRNFLVRQYAMGFLENYEVKRSRADGEEIRLVLWSELSPYASELRSSGSYGWEAKPGYEQRINVTDLRLLLDVSLAGTYRIAVERLGLRGLDGKPLKPISNTLSVTVKEPAFPIVSVGGTAAGPLTNPPVVGKFGSTVDGCALGISTDKDSYKPREPIMLAICCSNAGSGSLEIAPLGLLGQYKISAALPEGFRYERMRLGSATRKPPLTLAPLTLAGEREATNTAWRGILGRQLQPGEAGTVLVHLDRLLDFSMEGKYTLTVERLVAPAAPGTEGRKVTSNEIVVQVEHWHGPVKPSPLLFD